MDVAAFSNSVSVGPRIPARRSRQAGRQFSIVSFKTQIEESTTAPKSKQKLKSPTKSKQQQQPSSTIKPKPSVSDLDYNELASVLENIYKLSPALDVVEEEISTTKRKRRKQGDDEGLGNVVRSKNQKRRGVKRRLSLDKRIALRALRGKQGLASSEKGGDHVEKLLRAHPVSSDGRFDWKRMNIPPVLSSSEQLGLFNLMQPMKAIFELKENLHNDLNRDPTYGELASAVNMSVQQLRRHIEFGQAARNKLIKHNLRLVLFAIKKYFQDIANDENFQDLCQAGAMGLVTATDRFDPKRGFRLSTYGLFWIRHSIIRFMTGSGFTRVPLGIEPIRQKIQKAKLELMFELQRLPTEEEIIARVKISPERYHDVKSASKSVFSLNARHIVTKEEFINSICDIDGVGGEKRRQSVLLRLALDDVLDSLKPKESLVIRQRYGLDGKGDRTLAEIAGNLNISREMVRKHELKALMKLKHPARLDYLRRYI